MTLLEYVFLLNWICLGENGLIYEGRVEDKLMFLTLRESSFSLSLKLEFGVEEESQT